jgi:hypothetical protein
MDENVFIEDLAVSCLAIHNGLEGLSIDAAKVALVTVLSNILEQDCSTKKEMIIRGEQAAQFIKQQALASRLPNG